MGGAVGIGLLDVAAPLLRAPLAVLLGTGQRPGLASPGGPVGVADPLRRSSWHPSIVARLGPMTVPGTSPGPTALGGPRECCGHK